VKIFIVIFWTLFAWAGFAQNAAENNPWLRSDYEKSTKKPECEVDLDRESYLKILDTYKDAIDAGIDGKPIRTIHLELYRGTIANWGKFRYWELDTNTSKNWLKKLIKNLALMAQCNRAMDQAEQFKNNVEFEKAKKAYNQAVDEFIKEIKNPEKPEQKKKEQLKVQKVKEHKQYQEYLRKLQKEQKKGGGDDDDEAPAKSAGKK